MGGLGVVLARTVFNRENVWMLKRKWVKCRSISGEWWVHYWNVNGDEVVSFELQQWS